MSSDSIYTPPPTPTLTADMLTEKVERDEGRGGAGQEAGGGRPTVFFSTLWLSFLKALSRKAGQKVGCAGKVRISLGWVYTAEARAFPYVCPAPLCV